MTLSPGTQLDRYTIEALIGEGAMGRVYRAFDTRLYRPVAVKVLSPGPSGTVGDPEDIVAGALREARAAAAILHPNATAIFDADRIGDTSFIVMELVPGTSLRRFVGDGSVPLATRVRWLLEIAGALSAAHKAGVVHRDVKPENVIVRDDGLVKVLDFGIARLPVGEGETFTTLSGTGLVGTPAYMAPEQIRGVPLDARADQFAWGVLAYELLTGRLPWHEDPRSPFSLLSAILAAEPAPIAPEAGVPAEIVAAVRRAMSRLPDDRFPTISDAAAALSLFAGPRMILKEAPDSPPAPSDFAEQVAPSAQSVLPPPVVVMGPQALAGPAPIEIVEPWARTLASADVADVNAPPRFAEPDFDVPVDVDAHLALLPHGATVKGMFFVDLLKLGTTVIPPQNVFELAGIPPRRYLVFGDYPASENLRLTVAVAMILHPGVPLGEALRRVGQTAFDTVAASLVGKTLFGVFGRDLEPILLAGPRAYRLLASFGEVTAEKAGPGVFLFHAREFPAFLASYQIGALEGVLHHCRREGRIRVACSSLSEASVELTLL